MIRAKNLREAVWQDPFKPFQICMTDAKTFLVPHPEFIAIEPHGRTRVVYTPGWLVKILSIDLVTRLDMKPPQMGASGESSAA